ncbi:hypothetical protein J2T17_005369 [Paenibacillus mucilaginosus]|uniref:immunity protein Imm33 domain-containing protein n=1 Tax=Paenibacillus mucilaginosus TaxID=61624 RepID=UPI003D1D501E
MNELEQRSICIKYHGEYLPPQPDDMLGIARNAKERLLPINGLRHTPETGTSGWFIWAGEEFSEDPDFFVPMHVRHIEEREPQLMKYLGLRPGWRFLIAGDYEDVWYDETLLI